MNNQIKLLLSQLFCYSAQGRSRGLLATEFEDMATIAVESSDDHAGSMVDIGLLGKHVDDGY
jgi:hypothetical protein